MIRVFVVDDHALIRIGLRETFDKEPDIEVVGEADRLEGTAERIFESKAGVALLDVILGDGSGVELCRELQTPHQPVRCLMFTSSVDDGPLHESILAGAAGYLLKTSAAEDVVRAVRAVAEGRSLIDPAITERVLARLRQPSDDLVERLTAQERRVFDLIGEGLTNREIGERLHLADQTVKNYVSRVLTKLGLQRTRAALYSAKFGKPPT